MKTRLGNPLISFAAPLLIILALIGFLQRRGNDWVHSVPALFIGGGLILTGSLRRSRRRRMLLVQLRTSKKDESVDI